MLVVKFEKDGDLADRLAADTRDADKPFSSGAEGYYTSGKITIDGKRYQVSCSVVEIGSKGRHIVATKE